MSSKEYLLILADGVRKRHFHVTGKGKITKFVVQLEVDLKGEWKPILRFDTAHGFAHIDRYNIRGVQKKEVLDLSFEEILRYADVEINENWEKYVNNFFEGNFP